MSEPKHDVAIYMPTATYQYRRVGPGGGGAELQTVILAKELTARGLRVAHIVWPVENPVTWTELMPTLVERPGYQRHRRLTGGLAEARRIWRALADADARAYVFRGAGSYLLVGALFCRVRRRKLIFSGANDLDFTFDRAHASLSHRVVYRAALRCANAIVAQTEQQLQLARLGLPDRKPVTMIQSFVEHAATSTQKPEAFLWIGRLVDYKRPFEYVELARAMPEVRFRMLAFYPDPTTPRQLPEELQRAGHELPNLELVGQLPREQLLRLIDRSFAIVSTSTFEGMPNVVLEAWARGIPVAALECDPDGRIVENDAGRVAGGSRERLVEIARSLSRDGELRSQLGQHGREYVLEVHDPAVVGGLWKDLLDRVLG